MFKTTNNITSFGSVYESGSGGGTIDPAVLNVKKDKVCGYPKNRFEGILAIDRATNTISIEPNVVGGFDSFTMYAENTELVIDSKISLVLPTNINGMLYVSMNKNKELIFTDTFDIQFINWYAFTSVLYYNVNTSDYLLMGDERHGYQRDREWHMWAHHNLGTQYGGGLRMTDFLSDKVPSGTQAERDSYAQFTIESGEIADEDLTIEILEKVKGYNYDLFGRDTNGVWFRHTDNGGFACYAEQGHRLSYNAIDENGFGTQVECANNSFVLTHIVAINDNLNNLIAVQGQANYLTIQEARDNVVSELQHISFGDVPTPEMRLVGTVIYRTNDLFDNAVKANVAKVNDNDDWFDWRAVNFTKSTENSVKIDNISKEIQGVINGLAMDPYEFDRVQVDGGGIYTRLRSLGSDVNMIKFWQSDILQRYEFDSTEKIYLQEGTIELPITEVLSISWDEQKQKNVLSSGDFTRGLPLIYYSAQDTMTVTVNGMLIWMPLNSTVDMALVRLGRKSIMGDTRLISGFESSFENGGVTVLNGAAYILDEVATPDLDSVGDGYVIHGAEDCANITNYSPSNNLSDIAYLQDGSAIPDGKYVMAVVTVAVNENDSKLFIELPKKSYNTLAELETAIEYSKHSIPQILKENGVIVAVLGLKRDAGSYINAWTIDTETTEWKWDTYVANVSSPNYPSSYPNNSNTSGEVWGPVDSSRMILIFEHLETEQNYDYLYLKTGSGASSSSYNVRHHGYTTCPHETPIFYNRIVSWYFHTDGSSTRKGWKVNKYKSYHKVVVGATSPSFKLIDIRFI